MYRSCGGVYRSIAGFRIGTERRQLPRQRLRRTRQVSDDTPFESKIFTGTICRGEWRPLMAYSWEAFLARWQTPQKVTVTVERWVKRRSLEQLGYLWTGLYATIGEWMGESNADVVHELMKQELLPAPIIALPTGEEVHGRRTLKGMTSRQMSAYIESLHVWAGQHGFRLPEPREVGFDYERERIA